MDRLYNKVQKLAEISPVLVCGLKKESIKNAEFISATISSKELGIVNTSKGIKAPKWFVNVTKNAIDTVVIDGIDTINAEEQEKFYELIKYKTISSVEFGKKIKVIVLYNDLSKVSATITSLCQIVK
jgi:hypothetical protein